MTQGLINYPRDELLNFDSSTHQVSSKPHPKDKNAFSPVSAVSNEALEVGQNEGPYRNPNHGHGHGNS